MKAITIWQPWATLIMVGAKPFEFRGWPAPEWIIGADLGIHAGKRPMVVKEVSDLLERIDDPRKSWTTGLFPDKARPVLERALAQCLAAVESRGKKKAVAPAPLFDAPTEPIVAPTFEPLPYSAVLGIVECGRPRNAIVAAKDTFERVIVNDSDRDAHANWAWPMLNVRPFAEPLSMSGAQGFWEMPDAERMAAQ